MAHVFQCDICVRKNRRRSLTQKKQRNTCHSYFAKKKNFKMKKNCTTGYSHKNKNVIYSIQKTKNGRNEKTKDYVVLDVVASDR